MNLSKEFKTIIIYNLILLVCFSISVNSFVNLPNLNIVFYIIFHLSYIYLCFYYYNYVFYIIAFVYGILFDIFLLNNIGPHLLTFIIFITIFANFKKFLFQLLPKQITSILLLTLIFVLSLEIFFSIIIYDLVINYIHVLKLILFSLFIFFPSIIIFKKIDN